MQPIPSSSSTLPARPTDQPARHSSRIVQAIDITQPRRVQLIEPSYPYSFDLLAHHGCVNAICFSKTEQGRWLASGGDDKKVILWDFFSDFDQISPVAAFDGPAANVFSIDFSANGNWLVASGLDSRIFVYDLNRPSGPSSGQTSSPQSAVSILTPHTESCRKVTCHPHESNYLLSAAEDGQVFRHDLRTPEEASNAALLEARAQYTDLCWNPVSPDLFLASTNHTIKLYDRRKLGPNPITNVNNCLVSYTTNLIKPKPLFRIGHPEISSVTIDPTGQLLGVMMSKWYPTIWSLNDPHPLAVLKSEPTSNGDTQSEGGFRDVCTIKHGGFSNNVHSDSTYFAGGSDDFRCYGWKLPSISEMESQRYEVDKLSDWLGESTMDTCAYGNKTITVPMTISKPSFKLHGHRSIANSLVFHPNLPLICTSGVEKLVKVHSTRQVGWYPHQTSHSRAQTTSTTVRRKISVADRSPFIFGPSHRSQQHSTGRPEDEDLETLAMFDALLEREKEVGEQSLWLGLDRARDDDDDNELVDDDYFSYDDYSD
ncbi:hypothetical protein MJO28_011549 [Puccinia striiformis f. sp. tritici]|uniref:Uncharacterized protein n=2 Tax=Puccinia striiformis f. sp. tritici TaxID=168172 RepID=A0A0L0VPF7_9BASI|nr:hypothetical protein Pst134EB_021982 [Puccinia striiformis f. sp. tritici]KAI7944021.1 hypothetical protein MJO28_011549 [Puccinia striiformis f. sp. tritici]KAI7946794.1 hypothetical protein MJO29_011321 [Puccinia striiformis f. sp. tritici]KAI9599695.1 hypothetical protein KEM48_008909 [Puccinia striiformis f. sp. tritici PST-130]KNF01168.1 hypothetical protein PSTG_05522 [Puccinia striiformis f. sp. tritici PST-78]